MSERSRYRHLSSSPGVRPTGPPSIVRRPTAAVDIGPHGAAAALATALSAPPVDVRGGSSHRTGNTQFRADACRCTPSGSSTAEFSRTLKGNGGSAIGRASASWIGLRTIEGSADNWDGSGVTVNAPSATRRGDIQRQPGLLSVWLTSLTGIEGPREGCCYAEEVSAGVQA